MLLNASSAWRGPRPLLLSAALGLLPLLLTACPAGGPQQAAAPELPASDKSIVGVELAVAAPNAASSFTKLSAADTGLDFTNSVTEEKLLIEEIFTQSGLGSADYDGDGDLDLYLCSINGPNKLFRNDGGFKFTDVTAQSGAGLDGGDALGSCGIFADLAGDGQLDLYVCNRRGANQCFINQGGGQFKEDAAARGLASERSTVSAAVFDADRDGDLDLYLANYRDSNDPAEIMQAYNQGLTNGIPPYYDSDLHSRRPQVGGPDSPPALPAEFANDYYVDGSGYIKMKPHINELLINDGHGKFADHTEAAGMAKPAWSFQAQATDVNDDGYPDLYVSSDFEVPDMLWINNGNGTFSDKAAELTRKSPLLSMGVDSGDINNDGLSDLYTSDMLAGDYKRAKRQSGDMNQWRWELINVKPQPQMRNMLFLNRGGGSFTETGQLCNVTATEWTWSVRIADLNCDGLPELFATNGNVRDSMDWDSVQKRYQMVRDGASYDTIKQYFMSLPQYYTDDVIFTASEPFKYNKAEDNWGLHDEAMDCGASLADYDGDGDLDIICNNTNLPLTAWRNDLLCGQRVVLDLRQPGKNPEAIGAKVYAHCGADTYMREVVLARGFASAESSRLYLGLGSHDTIDRLEVRWPDLQSQVYLDLPAGRHYTVTRSGRSGKWQAPTQLQPLFEAHSLPYQQQERSTLVAEFQQEPLLPLQQDSLGTGIGLADYNGDGVLDIYCAGAAGSRGMLLRGGKPSGSGAPEYVSEPEATEAFGDQREEMSALWLDADGDARPDLLTSAGGMEGRPGTPDYESRLLLNQAAGFTPGTLPLRLRSTGSLCAADVDHDGDVDIFAAGEIEPYAFGRVVPSALWINEQGSFSEGSALGLPALQGDTSSSGQITEAQFADLNGDGWQDLLLARQWGQLEWLANDNGVFRTKHALSPRGFWRSLCLADFDGDGDIDLLAGNCGSNTKYHPKEGAPVTMFANDFDGNGSRDLVEVKYRKDGCMLPGRGRSCSGYAISYIPQKFPTWASFADATLEDVYGQGLASAERFDVESVESIVALNDGQGNFASSALPLAAQLAPAFGIAAGDFNNDGKLDAFMAQNFTETQPETGHWDMGYGVLLLGDGQGAFKALEPWQSGIYLYQDCRGVVAADVNQDGALDLAVSCSNANAQLLLGHKQGGSGISVTLQGKSPNTAAVGAKVTLHLADGSQQTRIVQAGSGYLASYSGPLHFGIADRTAATGITVLWPDGSTSESKEAPAGSTTLTQP